MNDDNDDFDTKIFAVIRNVKTLKAAEHNNLLKLQAARTKANQKRKPKYQAQVDAHFGM